MIVRFDRRAFGYHHSGRRMSATVFGSGGGFCTTAAVASCTAAAVDALRSAAGRTDATRRSARVNSIFYRILTIIARVSVACAAHGRDDGRFAVPVPRYLVWYQYPCGYYCHRNATRAEDPLGGRLKLSRKSRLWIVLAGQGVGGQPQRLPVAWPTR